jgi:hypothetical protein
MTVMPSPRKVVLYQLLSLDGVAEEPSEWISDDGPELIANLAKPIESQDDVLLSTTTAAVGTR